MKLKKIKKKMIKVILIDVTILFIFLEILRCKQT